MSLARSGARILADQLLLQGVNHLFCVPGEGMVPVLDALIDAPGVRVVVNCQESGSAFMACGYARLAGQPRIAAGHESGPRFLTVDDHTYPRRVHQRVEHRHHALSRNAEKVIDSLQEQLVGKYAGTAAG